MSKKTGKMVKCRTCNIKFYVPKCYLETKKYCSKKCYNKSMIKLICINGHNVLKCGRYKGGLCKQCIKDKHPRSFVGRPKGSKNKKGHKQFCSKNHDTFMVGRDKKGMCKECSKESVKKSRHKNRKKIRKSIKKWQKAHPAYIKLKNLRRHTKRSLRVPKFGQKGIKEFYNKCPKNKVIDHIIPLCGKLVSGLHVRWNLQYLTRKQNNKKRNKWDGTKKNNGWRKQIA